MINKIDFKAKNLTSNAGLFLLLENAKSNGIFDFIENDLVFDNDSTNKIKMNHIKTMLCGHFIGIDKLERLKLLQNDPLVNEFDISVKEPETVSRFLGNFNFKTTQMFRDINFKVFKKLLTKSKLTSITIDIDSSVINVEGHQEGASKGYNPKEGANKQVISSQADSLIKISRIWADFFPANNRISLFRLFFPPFLALFPVFTEISPTDVSFGPPETGWPG